MEPISCNHYKLIVKLSKSRDRHNYKYKIFSKLKNVIIDNYLNYRVDNVTEIFTPHTNIKYYPNINGSLKIPIINIIHRTSRFNKYPISLCRKTYRTKMFEKRSKQYTL